MDEEVEDLAAQLSDDEVEVADTTVSGVDAFVDVDGAFVSALLEAGLDLRGHVPVLPVLRLCCLGKFLESLGASDDSLERRVFDVPKATARMLRRDAEAAGVDYEDAQGRVLVFHGLRNTFITNLHNSGATLKTVMELGRHSTPALTMRYARTDDPQKSEAIHNLPDFDPVDDDAKQATGTTDTSAIAGAPATLGTPPLPGAEAGADCPSYCPELSAQPRPTTTPRKDGHGRAQSRGISQDRDKKGLTETDRTSSSGGAMAGLGLEPRTHGLKGRCSTD